MNILHISFLESIYLIYMFLFFKTNIDFNVFDTPKGWWFEHLVGNHYGLRICPFGRIAIFVLIFILLIRNFINIPVFIIKIILLISLILSFMNLNAFVYLIPIWVIEYKNLS